MKTPTIFTRCYRTVNKVIAALRISTKQHEMLLGLILGDLHLERPSTKHNTRATFKQSSIHAAYLQHLWSMFSMFCGSTPKSVLSYDTRPRKARVTEALRFNTLSLPQFNAYHDRFYTASGVKIVPNDIANDFTACSLAYMFIDDGYKGHKGYYLCTESFSYEDNIKLLAMLKNKFGLVCMLKMTTNGWRVFIKRQSAAEFAALIKPHIVEHFNYKLYDHSKPLFLV